MTNRRQFFATLCGMGTTCAVTAVHTASDAPAPDAASDAPAPDAYSPFTIFENNRHGECRFLTDAQGRLWIRSNDGPYRQVVTR